MEDEQIKEWVYENPHRAAKISEKMQKEVEKALRVMPLTGVSMGQQESKKPNDWYRQTRDNLEYALMILSEKIKRSARGDNPSV